MDQQNGERRSVNGLALRWSHLALASVVYLLTIGVIYGTMRTQIDELRTERGVNSAQFQEFKEDVQRRLDRMEKDLDEIKRAALRKEIQDLH